MPQNDERPRRGLRELSKRRNARSFVHEYRSGINFRARQIVKSESGKLLLVSDGIETDGDALTQAAKIAMEGVIVDVVEFSNGNYGKEIQLLQINLPQETIVVGQSVQIELIVQRFCDG